MKPIAIGLGIALLIVSLSYGQSNKTEDFLEQPFQEDGKVHLSLASGSYVVRGGRSDRIFVHWRVDKSQDMEKIRVRVNASGSDATVRVQGPARRADVVIEVPARSDLYLRMMAGEIKIEGVEGNKDIRMTAGDLSIDAEPDSYSRVHASVTFGDLDGSSFQISKSGIARSFDWHGMGAYTLRASLFAGDLKLSNGRPRRP